VITDLTYKAHLSAITVTSIYQSFTHKMAAKKINWHRYGTKLRHCHPTYKIEKYSLQKNKFSKKNIKIFVLRVRVGLSLDTPVLRGNTDEFPDTHLSCKFIPWVPATHSQRCFRSNTHPSALNCQRQSVCALLE